MIKKKDHSNSFNQGHGKPGWIYVVRNDLMREDIYKVGFTLKSPDSRASQLNTEQRGGTSRIGFFNLVFAAAVLDAQGSEAALLRRLDVLRESRGKEFVNAPLELIIGEMLNIQKRDHERASATASCPSCMKMIKFCPHPMMLHKCTFCGNTFRSTERGEIFIAPFEKTYGKTYVAPSEFINPAKRSPLAEAFLQIRKMTRQYCDGSITNEEFFKSVEHWTSYDPPLDRSPIPYPKAAMRSKGSRRKSFSLLVQDGYAECPDCLSTFPKQSENETIKCPECGCQKLNFT